MKMTKGRKMELWMQKPRVGREFLVGKKRG